MAEPNQDKITNLTEADIPAAVDVLLDAFTGDPLMNFLFPEYARDARQIRLFYAATLEYVLTSGEVYAAPGMAGIAAWYIPHALSGQAGQVAHDLRARVKSSLDEGAFRRLSCFTEAAAAYHRKVMEGRRVYLEFLAVRRGEQGRGIGGLLLENVLAKADELGLPCLLDTMSARNPPFYRAHGFEVCGERVVCEGGPYTWTMLRQAR
jgi:ribosomal protein S18 acetylase RimI-like enzyme